jgi:energy-coupling factor transport system ATP-binding protein
MIRFDHVSFHYGGERGTGEGVDDLDFTIQSGELVVLCGPSGCGKTTVTRLINGLAPHFYPGELEGTVWVDDLCVSTAPLSETSRLVGSVFQNPKSQFFNVDTTGELVFGCENQGIEREEIRRRLDKTRADMRLDALMGRNIFELSGGEKQQIACGSVYTAQPEVFVLDEPSSNLDKKAILRLHEMIRKIKSEGKTIVISEHRLYYLMDLADRFLYLDDGIVTRSFTPSQLRALPDEDLSSLGLRCTDLKTLTRSPAIGEIPRSGKAALETIDLSCSRGNHQILDVDRMSFPEHGIIAMIGDNGCGKSTLAESLCGVIPSSGSVAFDGKYLTDKERSRRSFLVMQDVNRQLFSDSVIEEVMLNAPVDREQAEQVLDSLGLLEQSERHPSSLSGGQKQRVAIASALCAGKDILFYDEPTSGLDRGGMERFGALLRRMQDTVTSVIITHDPELILQCCTHILHVENGRVLGFYPLNDEGVQRMRWYFLSESEESTSKRREKLGIFGKVLQYAGKWKRTTYWAVAFMILGALCSVAPYFGVYTLIERLLSGVGLTLRTALPAILTVLIFGVLYAITYTVGLQLSHKAAYHTLENLRVSLQGRLESQPLGNVQDLGTGAVKKLFNDDIESIELMLAHVIPEGIANLTVPAVVLLVLIAVDWQMAMLTLIMLGFGMGASKQMVQVGMDRMGSYFAASKRLNNTIIEYVSGMEVVRVFNRQGESGKRFEEAVNGYRDFALAWYKVCWPWMALYGSLFANVTLYSLPFGALMVLLGNLTLSRYVLALCLSFAIGPLLLRTLALLGALPQVNYKIQALEKALDRPPLKCGEEAFRGINHSVSFDRVRFAYKSDEVLKGVSFTAEEGKMTALVGESGSGKSTIARLLSHYYDVSAGEIRIGGQKLQAMSLDALSGEVAYVSQELFLFNKSILENIRVGRPDASDEEVKAAARKAQCEDFILQLPQSYDTPAGLAGSKLSGGQRQRIAFARVLLKDAPIIVLDEATAFIDPENEQKMNEAIAGIIRNKTVLVIAHKLSSIVSADKIIVLRQGKIDAQGTHTELLRSSEEYRKLWSASEESRGWMLKGGESA